jgi:hypothetical protein
MKPVPQFRGMVDDVRRDPLSVSPRGEGKPLPRPLPKKGGEKGGKK